MKRRVLHLFSFLKSREGRPVGETWVWLTGFGVAAGLLMVCGLLWIIFIQGMGAFWPKEIDEWELTLPSGKHETLFASVAKERTRGERGPAGGVREIPEWQLYLGNRDVYGQSYRYIDASSVRARRRADDLVLISRLENGSAIGIPLSVVTEKGERITASNPSFRSALDRLVREGERKRGELRRIERGSIASLNEKLSALRREIRVLEARGASEASAAEIRRLRGEAGTIEKEYARHAVRAVGLRRELEKAPLTYAVGDGTERSVPTGKIVFWTEPNRLGFGGKLGFFLARLWEFCTDEPREANTEGGIFPAIFGTFAMTLLMSALVTPLGVVASIYLREYAGDGPLVRMIRICVNNLAGVPSIVFGVFGLGFFVYVLGGSLDHLFFSEKLEMDNAPTFGTPGILWASLTLALMTLPVVIVATEEALATVPRGLREAALACGASQWQMIQRVVLPGALPGVLTGLILAMARGAGEVAPLMLTGVVKLAPSLPVDWSAPFIHLERKFMHLGFHIYDVGFQSPDSDAAQPMVFATTLLLIALVVAMNMAAIMLRNRIRRRHCVNSF